MEISYWTSRWKSNKTGWHLDRVYPPLQEHWKRLSLDEGDHVLVPLCGKSLDMAWLADRGLRVTGVEVSELAVLQFFKETERQFTRHKKGPFTIYESGNIQVWQGNFFRVEPHMLPPIRLIYDRAALVALPRDQRKRYERLVNRLTSDETCIFLSTFEYPQEEMNGPPFAVFENEIIDYFGHLYGIDLLQENSISDNLSKFKQRGLSSYLIEKIYYLQPR